MRVRELLKRVTRLARLVGVEGVDSGELRSKRSNGARPVKVPAVRGDEEEDGAVERGGLVVHRGVHLQEEVERLAGVEALELRGGGHVHRVEPRGSAAHLGRKELPLERLRGGALAEPQRPLLIVAVGFVVVLGLVRDVLVRVAPVLVRVGDNLIHRAGGVLGIPGQAVDAVHRVAVVVRRRGHRPGGG